MVSQLSYLVHQIIRIYGNASSPPQRAHPLISLWMFSMTLAASAVLMSLATKTWVMSPYSSASRRVLSFVHARDDLGYLVNAVRVVSGIHPLRRVADLEVLAANHSRLLLQYGHYYLLRDTGINCRFQNGYGSSFRPLSLQENLLA
jgi:hypothetical protein